MKAPNWLFHVASGAELRQECIPISSPNNARKVDQVFFRVPPNQVLT